MSVFGWCFGPVNTVPNHDACPYEIGSSAGIVRCGCGCHEGHPGKSAVADTISGEGHPRGNGDGPLTRTTRLNREGATPMLGVPTVRNPTQARAGGEN